MKGVYLFLAGFLVTSLAFGQAGNYRSITTGPWGTPGTWERDADSNGSFEESPSTVAPTTPGTAGTITIRNGHSVNVAANVSIDQTTIQSGGVLVVDATFTLTLNSGLSISVDAGGSLTINGALAFGGIPNKSVAVNGTLNNNGSFSGVSPAKLTFGSGSNYFHKFANGGTIPSATWNSNSTVNIVGYTSGNSTAPSGLNQTFGHFVWNAPGQDVTISLGGLPTNINGDFRIESTGVDALFYSLGGAGGTMNIGGNFDINGGTLGWTSGDASVSILNISGNMDVSGTSYVQFGDDKNLTINLTGNFVLTGSAQIDFSATIATTNLNIQGNYTFSGGDIYVNGGIANINFTGASTKVYTSTLVPTGNVNYSVSTLSTLTIAGSDFVGGGGTFNLSGTLQIGSTNSGGALQTGTAGGNIRVSGTRTYASNSTIIYNGSGPQFIGNGFPSGSDVNLTINNSSGVTLSSSLDIVALRVLTLTSGNISIGAQTLTINGAVSGSGGIVGGATSNLTIGGTGNFGTLTFSGTNQLLNFTLNRTSSGLVTLGGDLTIVGTFTQTDGDLDLNGHVLTLSGNFARTTGDLMVNSASTLSVDGSGTLPSDISLLGTTLGTLTLNRASSTFTTNSSLDITNLNLSSGSFTNGTGIGITTGGTITRRAAGTISNSPNNTTNAYNVVYNNSSTATTGPELPTNSTALSNLTKSGSGALTLGSNITVNGALTLSSGSFNAGSNTINLKGNLVSNASSTLTSSTITFSGTTTLSGSSAPVFGAITISGSLTPSSNFQVNGNLANNGTLNAGSATTTFGGTTTISGTNASSFNNVTVTGTLTAPAAVTMNVAGDFTNNGTFNHNNGTVTFNGTTSILGSATTSLFGVNISGSLTAPATTLNIAGNWATTGTFTHNGGKIVLNGTVSAQSITGTVNVNDIDISSATGANMNGTMNLSGTMTLLSGGIFDADGSGSGILTIKSTAVNAGGRIATLPTPANFSGNVTVERFVNSPAGWRYLSMPITNGNVGNWKSVFPVTGSFSDASPVGVNNVTSSTDPSIYYYNASTQAYVAVGSGGSTASTSLSNLIGYSPYTFLSGNFTVTTRGTIRTGNATVPVSSGYNLVPNPYPSPIDWDNITRTGFSSTMSIRTANNVFASYVAGGAATNAPFGGWTGEVATGQSFWVQSTGATSLNLTESAKTGNQYQFLREATPSNLIRVILASDNHQRDETVIWFPEGATNSVDDLYDAKKMRNGYFEPGENTSKYLNIASYTEEQEFAINGLAKLKCNGSINLRVTDVSPGKHTISFADMETFLLGYQVILVDRLKKVENVVSNDFAYDFEISENEQSYGDHRFVLRLLTPESAYINSQTAPKVTVTNPCDLKMFPITVMGQKDVSYQFFLGTEPVSELIQVTKSGEFMVNIPKDKLQAGSNKLSIQSAQTLGCDSYLFVDAVNLDNQSLVVPVIEKSGIKLTSNITDKNLQWTLNGNNIEGATESTFWAVSSGLYRVSVSTGICTLSSESVEITLEEGEILAFPIPTSDIVHVVLPSEMAGKVTGIYLRNTMGQLILDHTTNPDILRNDVKILDLSNEKPGLYLLTIDAQERHTIKIIKK